MIKITNELYCTHSSAVSPSSSSSSSLSMCIERTLIYSVPTVFILLCAILHRRWDVMSSVLGHFMSLCALHAAASRDNMQVESVNNKQLEPIVIHHKWTMMLQNACLYMISPFALECVYNLYSLSGIDAVLVSTHPPIGTYGLLFIVSHLPWVLSCSALYWCGQRPQLAVFFSATALISALMQQPSLQSSSSAASIHIMQMVIVVRDTYFKSTTTSSSSSSMSLSKLTDYEVFVSVLSMQYLLVAILRETGHDDPRGIEQSSLDALSSQSGHCGSYDGYQYSLQQCSSVAKVCTGAVVVVLIIMEMLMFMVQHHLCRLFHRADAATYARLAALPVAAAATNAYMLAPLLRTLQVPSFVVWTIRFVLKDLWCPPRGCISELSVSLYWLVLLILAISGACIAVEKLHWTKTCARKIFHFLVVLLFAPLIAASCTLHIPKEEGQFPLVRSSSLFGYLVFCLAVALVLFLVLEYVRLGLLPVTCSTRTHRGGMLAQAGQAMDHYMRMFVHGQNGADGSSHGAVDGVETAHISLLVGSASSIWFYAALCMRPSVTQKSLHTASSREWLLLSLLPHLGLISIGIGDACAAIAGSLYGKRRWRSHLTDWLLHARGGDESTCLSARTYLGSGACFASMLSVSVLLLVLHHNYYGNHIVAYAEHWFNATDGTIVLTAVTFTLLMTTLAEAFTQENDNIILPLYCMILFSAIVRCCS